MVRLFVIATALTLAWTPSTADGQMLGTFRWQLQPTSPPEHMT